MGTDLRHTIRTHRRAPAFTMAAVLTLALGISGTTVIFSVVDGILLRPLPYPVPEALVRIIPYGSNGRETAFAAANYLDIARETTAFSVIAGYREDVIDVTGTGEPIRVRGAQTTASFFEVFGVAPVAGRLYGSDDRPGSALVVVSDGFWTRQFGRRLDAIGSRIGVNGVPSEIVGVVPATFSHPLKADLWALSPLAVPTSPIPVEDGLADRNVGYFGAVARLAPAATLAEANAQLEAAATRLADAYPDSNRGATVRAQPLAEALVTDVRAGLLVLLGGVVVVLLIACANVAGLLLARGLARRHELAVRASLGASRPRLAAQLLVESLVLAFAGGGAGVLAAAWGLDLLIAVAPESLPRLDEVHLDWRAALAAVLATTIVGVAAGLAPALQFSRPDLNGDLKDGGRTDTSARTRLRSTLVVAEVAAALVLSIGAGLLFTSLSRLQAVDPGFHTASLVAVELPLPLARYDEAAQKRFYADVLERVRATPVAARSAMVFPIPLRGSTASASVDLEGRPAGQEPPVADLNAVSPTFFETAGIALITGRVFDEGDRNGRPPVAIVNQRLARELGGDPIGRRINLGEWVTIVGIVADVRRQSLDAAPRPGLYLPYQQFVLPYMGLVVRTDRPTATVAAEVRAAVRGVDPDLPVGDVLTIDQIIDRATGQPRLHTWLLMAFAGFAAVLAAVGLYGLTSLFVSQRTREMGVRLALGASQAAVAALVLRQGLRLAALGVLIGLAAAGAVAHVLTSVLFETSAMEPGVYTSLAAALLTVAALACYVPARRAMRVDPVRALRAD